MKYFRWVFFIVAMIAIVTFPSDFMTSLRAMKQVSTTFAIVMLPVGIAIRIALIWILLWMWWKYRNPVAADNNPE
jgi:multisubunit Na+/H+ antiporter MnhG subunit